VPEDLRDTYLAEPKRRTVQGELGELNRRERPARPKREEPTVRRAEILFKAAASDLSEVRREFSGRRAGGVYGSIVGQSPRLMQVLRMVEKLAPSSSTVLIRGESGTGRSSSPRRCTEPARAMASPS